MNNDQNLKVAIVIVTLNRSEFLVRQLRYYAAANCPHSIYIGDTSTILEHVEKTKKAIRELASKLDIHYYEYPGQVGYHCIYFCLKNVKEKYACFNGDDDFYIPDTLTECARFLESNPDHSTATGLVVNFMLNESGAYGTIKHLKDYPRPEVGSETGSERIVNFFNNYFVLNISVNRTHEMVKNWETYNYKGLSDISFAAEIIPGSLSLIDGKAKTINRLGLVRQMHDRQYRLDFVYDWIAQKDWPKNYEIFLELLSKRLMAKDNISQAEAEKAIRQGLWLYIQKGLIREYPEAFPDTKVKNPLKSKLKKRLVKAFPFLKTVYRRLWMQKIKKKVQLHYEVLRPDSPYYKDFQPVLNSFTSKQT